MNTGKTVFSQILDHLPRYEFDKFVKKHEGNRRVRKFPCYDQFLCLAYAQLTYRESLRDIETCLNSHREKLYHVGFRGLISRSTLAPDGHLKIPHLWPGQNPPPQGRQNGFLFSCFSFLMQVF